MRALFSHVLRGAPGYILIGCLLILIAQVAGLLYMWLPWKLLVILSGAPASVQLPDTLRAQPVTTQVQVLAAGTVLAFLASQGADLLFRRGTRRGALGLVRRSGKTGLFNNQDQVAETVFQRIVAVTGASLVWLLASALLGWLYPTLWATFWLWTGLTTALAALILARWPAARHWAKTRVGRLFNIWTFLGFVSVLAVLLAEYGRGRLPPLLIVVLAILVLRQSLSLYARVAQHLIHLHGQLDKARALFVPQALWSGAPAAPGPFDSVQENLDTWLPALLASASQPPADYDNPSRQWLDNGAIALIWLDNHLVKLFKHSHNAAARQEADLMHLEADRLPGPTWLGEHHVQGFVCHLWRLDGWHRPNPADEGRLVGEMRQTLLEYVPSAALIDLYRRSRPLLGQRIDATALADVATDPAQRDSLACFHALWPRWRSDLDALPLRLILPGWGNGKLLVHPDGRTGSSHGAGWRLDPFGAGWPVAANQEMALAAALARVSANDASLARLTFALVLRAARLHEFERLCAVRHFGKAFDLLGVMLADDGQN